MSTPVTRGIFPNRPTTTGHGRATTIHVAFAWTPTDAATITVHLTQPGFKRQDWLIGRDLLAAGLNHPAGIGDITIAPSIRDNGTELVLRDPAGIGGNLSILLPTDALHRFVERTELQVAAGAERYEWDINDLHKLLEQGEGAA